MKNSKLEDKNSIFEEQKKLVLARFKTLNPEAKLILGGEEEITVRDIIRRIEKEDDFGKRVIHAQIKMLRVLAGGD